MPIKEKGDKSFKVYNLKSNGWQLILKEKKWRLVVKMGKFWNGECGQVG